MAIDQILILYEKLCCAALRDSCAQHSIAVVIKCSVSLIKTLQLKCRVKSYKVCGDARQIQLARYPYFVTNKLMLTNITQRNNSNINRYLELDAIECRHSVPIGRPCCVSLEVLNMLQTFGNSVLVPSNRETRKRETCERL
jgi:hypothetical protein